MTRGSEQDRLQFRNRLLILLNINRDKLEKHLGFQLEDHQWEEWLKSPHKYMANSDRRTAEGIWRAMMERETSHDDD